MRLFHLSATLSVVALLASACDDTVTGPYARSDRSPALGLDQAAPNNDQPAPVDVSQEPPSNDQAAPIDFDQDPQSDGQDPPTSSGATAPSSDVGRACVTFCTRYTALNCSDDDVDCDSECAEMAAELPSSCRAPMIAYMSCISGGCDLYESCALEVSGVAACLMDSGLSSGDDTTATPGGSGSTPTNSGNGCNTSNSCSGCANVCDACMCAAQAAGLSTSTATSTCSTSCSTGA